MHRNDRIIVFLGVIIAIIALVGAGVGGSPKMEEDTEPEINYHDLPIKSSAMKHITGEVLNEYSGTLVEINDINESYVTKVYFELHWEDEANIRDPGVGKIENQPDYFNFTVITPWQAEILSDTVASEDGAGVIMMEIPVPEDGEVRGKWSIFIYCGECGDQVVIGPLGRELFTYEEDTGNGWELSYKFDFHTQY